MGDHIYDNVGVDAQGAVKLVVPHSVDLGSFPAASTQKGGWRLDAMSGDMLWSNGVVWRKSGSVASVAAADLSPLFTTVVNNPTTDPSIVFTLPNINQYEVFGRSAAGSGAPGWVTLSATAFTGYSNGAGISISGGVITNTLPSLWKRTGTLLSPLTANDTVKIGTSNTGVQTLLTLENTSADVNRAVRIDLGGGGVIQSYPDAVNSFTQFLGGANGVRFGTIAYGNIFFAIDTGSYALLYTNQYSDTRLAVHRGTADTALHVGGEVKIDTINNYASATQILVNNGNVISYATKADLGIPTVTPSAISKIDDTNVTLTLGGGYATALLQASSLTLGWTGILAYGRGGTGLGTLGTANQILRVNAGATALEYFSPTWTSNTGTVTNFSAHDLTTGFTYPLFTVNVTNPTTLPDLTFTLPTLPQNFVFAAPWGGVTGTPLWRQLLPSDLARDGASTGQVITWNGSAWVPGAGGSGTVTTVNSGNGMNFSPITATGTITMGTPSSITLVSSNSTSTTSHTHAFAPGGTSSQVILGNGGFGSYVPGLWQRTGSELKPLNANDTVRITTTSTGVQTLLSLANTSADVNRAVRIELGAGGIIQSYPDAANSFIQFLGGTNGVRFGTIAGGTFMSLTDNGSYVLLNTSQFVDTRLAVHRGTASATLHVGGNAILDTINKDNALTNFLVITAGNEIKYRELSSLSGASPVWKIQGGTTDATSNTDAIYHANKVLIGTTGSSSYMLSVNGNGYFNNGIDINNFSASSCAIRAADNTATFRNVAYLDGSNIFNFATTYVKVNGVGVSDAGAVTLSAYGSGRTLDSISINPDNLVYFSTAGKMLKARGELFKDDGGSASITTSETNHIADSTPRRITFDTLDTVQDTYFTFDMTSGDVKLKFGSADMKYMFWIYIEYTTGGTPTIKMDARKSSSATIFRTVTKTSPNARDFIILQGFASGATSDYLSIVLTVSGAALTSVVKAEAFLIPIGLSPP